MSTSGPDDPVFGGPPPENPVPADLELAPLEDHFNWDHPDYQGQRPTRRRRRTPRKVHKWYRLRNVVLACLLALVLVVAGFLLYLNAQLGGIRRAPFLAEYRGDPGIGTNILLVGSESPAHSLAADPATLVIQLVHLSADHRQAAVIHFPRDLYLPVPGATPVVDRTLEATYRLGGNPLVVQSLQADLDLLIDHVVQVGFVGYRKVTDRLGGVDMPTAAGVRHFSGAQALSYADATTGLVNGDIDTGHRHQEWLKAMLKESLTPSVLLDPLALVGLLHDMTPNAVVDDAFSTSAMRGLAWHSRHLRAGSIRYLTAPYAKFAKRGDAGRVLLPDGTALVQLGTALRTDNQSGIASFDN